jgi:hypothetical protein
LKVKVLQPLSFSINWFVKTLLTSKRGLSYKKTYVQKGDPLIYKIKYSLITGRNFHNLENEFDLQNQKASGGSYSSSIQNLIHNLGMHSNEPIKSSKQVLS